MKKIIVATAVALASIAFAAPAHADGNDSPGAPWAPATTHSFKLPSPIGDLVGIGLTYRVPGIK